MGAPASRPIIIGVVGGEEANEPAKDLARRVGALVAKKGGIIICGGGGGVMDGVCEGAFNAGGTTIGVLPSSSPHDANPYVTIPIVTAMGTARNVIIVRTADALIAIDGSFGTLTEIAYALDLDRSVVILKSWEIGKMGVDRSLFIEATTPEDAVAKAYALAESRRR